jgi:hypothetical protein
MSHERFNFPECIITGCLFHDPVGGRFIVADLHRLGDCYVINGNPNKDGEAAWIYSEPTHPVYRRIISVDNAAYFERRGVIVFTTRVAVFNKEAEDYVAGVIRWPAPAPTYPNTAGDAA